MPDLKIGATMDLGAALSALKDGQVSFEDFCSRLNISFQQVSTSTQRWSQGTQAAFKRLSEDVAAGASSVSEGAQRMARATQENATAQAQLRIATRISKDEAIDYTLRTNILASAQENAAQKARSLADAQRAAAMAAQEAASVQSSASQQASAQTVVRTAASGGVADDQQLAVAAATRELAAAKAELAEVTAALNAANLDEVTSNQALANAQAAVTAAEGELSAAKATLAERTEAATLALQAETEAATAAAEMARVNAEVDALAADSSASEQALRLAQAYLGKASAQQEVKRVTDLANASTADQTTKAAILAPALERERAAIQELAYAQKAFAETSDEASVAQGRLGEAASHSVTSMTAASGAIRVFDGALPIRAVENFITKILPLGGILQAAFPIIGLIALGEMFYHIAEQIDLVGEKSEIAAEKLRRDFQQATSELKNTALQLEATNEKLQDSIDKLEKKPGTGLESGIAQARMEAAKLGEELDKDLDKIDEVGKKHNVGFWSGLFGQEGETKDVTAALLNAKREVDDVRHSYDATIDNARADNDTAEHIEGLQQAKLVALQKIYDKVSAPLQASLANAQAAQSDHASSSRSAFGNEETYGDNGSNGLKFSSTRDNTKAIGLLQSGLQVFQSEQEIIGGEYRKSHLEVAKSVLEGAKSVTDAQKKAAEDLLKGFEEERTAQIGKGSVGAQADLDFWSGKIQRFQQGSEQYKTVQAKINADRATLGRSDEAYTAEQTKGAEIKAKEAEALALANVQYDLASGKINKVTADQRIAAIQAQEYTDKIAALRAQLAGINADKSLSPEDRRNKAQGVQNSIDEAQGQAAAAAVQEQARAVQAAQEAKQKDAEAQEKLNTALSNGAEVEQQNAFALTAARISAMEQSGALTKLAADQQMAALHTAEHTARLKELQAQLAALREEAKSLPPGSPAATNNAAQQVNVENKISQENGKGQLQSFQDASAIQQQVAQPWTKAFDTIESSWMSTQRSILTGQRSVAQAFRQMGDEMALGMIQNFEKMIFSALAYELRTLAAHTAGNAAKTASDATASATGNSIKRTNALQEVFIDAKTAAASTWKALAGIPIVGPVLAPVAAGAAFAGVMALAAFEQGGVVNGAPGMAVPVLAHAGERILTVNQTSQFHQLLEKGGGSGGDLHLHMGGNTFHGDAKDNYGDFDDRVHKSVKNLHRNQKLSFLKG